MFFVEYIIISAGYLFYVECIIISAVQLIYIEYINISAGQFFLLSVSFYQRYQLGSCFMYIIISILALQPDNSGECLRVFQAFLALELLWFL